MELRRKIALWLCPELSPSPADRMAQKLRRDLCGGPENNPFSDRPAMAKRLRYLRRTTGSLSCAESWVKEQIEALAPIMEIDTGQEFAEKQSSEESDFINFIRADYFRSEQPTFNTCYRMSAQVANSHGWLVPSKERTAALLYGTAVEGLL